jgi:hypothetical protein
VINTQALVYITTQPNQSTALQLWPARTRPTTPGAGRPPSPPPREVKLRDPSGRLRLPAYILIALVITLAAILLVVAGLLLAPS